jgi:hypothetical protein
VKGTKETSQTKEKPKQMRHHEKKKEIEEESDDDLIIQPPKKKNTNEIVKEGRDRLEVDCSGEEKLTGAQTHFENDDDS